MYLYMNKLLTATLLSLWVSIASPSVQASEFWAAAFSPDIFDVIFNSKDATLKKVGTNHVALDSPKNIDKHGVKNVRVSKMKKKVKYEVSQIVWDKFIFTTQSAINSVKTTDCREKWKYRYYFSDEKDIIGSDNFSTLTQQQVEKILALPKCKK